MKRTEEEKQAWRDKMQKLVSQVRSMSDTERAELSARINTRTCEGHALSAFNQYLLALQSPLPVTIIGGFKQWQRQGSKVKAGEHACGYIYVPLIAKKDIENNEQPDDVRFRLVPVFDITQTELAVQIEN